MSYRHREKGPLDSPELPQRLDFTEKFFCKMHDRGILLESCTVFLEASVPLSLQVLRQTAWHWANRHPRLRARIASNGHNYKEACFVEMSSLTVDDMPVQEVGHGDWKYANETELEEMFDCLNGPLWRLRFVPGVMEEFDTEEQCDVLQENSGTQTEYPERNNSAIIFVLHHCITDGIGIAYLMGEYIDILTCLLRKQPVYEVLEPRSDSTDNILEPLSLVKNVGIRLLALPLPGFSHVHRQFIRRNMGLPVKTRHAPVLPVGKYQKPLNRIIPLVMSEVDTASLVKRCRQRGCTVQGVLQAAIGLTLAQIRPGEQKTEKNIPDDFEVQYVVPVGLRQRLPNTPIPNSAIRNYVADIFPKKTFSSDLSQDDLWEAAREISNDIHRRIKDNEPIELLRYSLSPHEFLERSVKHIDVISNGAHRKGWNSNVVFMSNLGVCGCLDEKDAMVKPKATLLGLSTNNSSFMFTLKCITTNKRLCVTITTRRNLVSDELAADVSQAFKRALQVFIT